MFSTDSTYCYPDAISYNGTSYVYVRQSECYPNSDCGLIPNGGCWVTLAQKGDNGTAGSTGPTGSTGPLTTTNYWNVTGNAGTNSGTNFAGTTDSAAWVVRTNNTPNTTYFSDGTVFNYPADNFIQITGNTNNTPIAIGDVWLAGYYDSVNGVLNHIYMDTGQINFGALFFTYGNPGSYNANFNGYCNTLVQGGNFTGNITANHGTINNNYVANSDACFCNNQVTGNLNDGTNASLSDNMIRNGPNGIDSNILSGDGTQFINNMLMEGSIIHANILSGVNSGVQDNTLTYEDSICYNITGVGSNIYGNYFLCQSSISGNTIDSDAEIRSGLLLNSSVSNCSLTAKNIQNYMLIGSQITGDSVNMQNIFALGQSLNMDTATTAVNGYFGITATINLQPPGGTANGYVLTSDANGNASWQPTALPVPANFVYDSALTTSFFNIVNYTVPANGDYTLEGFINPTTGDISDYVNITMTWTDNYGNSKSLQLGPSNIDSFTSFPPVSFRARAGSNVTVSSSVTGSPVYDVDLRIYKK